MARDVGADSGNVMGKYLVLIFVILLRRIQNSSLTFTKESVFKRWV